MKLIDICNYVWAGSLVTKLLYREVKGETKCHSSRPCEQLFELHLFSYPNEGRLWFFSAWQECCQNKSDTKFLWNF